MEVENKRARSEMKEARFTFKIWERCFRMNVDLVAERLASFNLRMM